MRNLLLARCEAELSILRDERDHNARRVNDLREDIVAAIRLELSRQGRRVSDETICRFVDQRTA